MINKSSKHVFDLCLDSVHSCFFVLLGFFVVVVAPVTLFDTNSLFLEFLILVSFSPSSKRQFIFRSGKTDMEERRLDYYWNPITKLSEKVIVQTL